MAQWDITVPAGSVVDGDTGGRTSIVSGRPSDFDGATINSVTFLGTPTVTSDGAGGLGGTTDDTWLVRWNIETSAFAATYGGTGDDADAICWGRLGDSVASANVTAGSAPTPAPTTAVASDWDNIHYQTFSTVNMKDDDERGSWASFTIRVDYTPAAPSVSPNMTGTGTASPVGTVVSRQTSLAYTGTGTPTQIIRPRVWLNSTPDLTGSPTEMTVTSYNEAGTSITFSDPSGAPTGSLYLIVENLKTGEIGSIAVTVNQTGGTYTGTFSGTGATTLTKELSKSLTYAATGASTVAKESNKVVTFSGTGSVASVRLLGRTFTYSGTGAPTLARAVNRLQSFTFSGTGSSVLTAIAQRVRAFTYSGTGASTLARITDRLRSFTYSGTGTQVGEQVRVTLLDLNYTGTGTASTPPKQVGKPLTHSGTGSLAVARSLQLTKSLAFAGTGASTIAKGLGKSLSFAGTGALATTAQLTFLVSAAMSGTGAVTLTKQIGKTLAAAASGAVQIAKETGKALAYTANGALAALQAASYVSAFSYSGVGSVVSQQDLGLQEQNLNFTGTGTVTRGPWVFGKFLPYTGFGVPTQENDGTPITTGFTVGDDNWWRWRRIMFKRNRARFKRNK